jgi:hypothetical protein
MRNTHNTNTITPFESCNITTFLDHKERVSPTLVDTKLLLISSISGAIHGRVPLIPPETIVVCFTLDKPKSATCNRNLPVAPF